MSKPSRRPGRAERAARGRSNSEVPAPLPSIVRSDLLESLSEQEKFLHSSCNAFDAGELAEAKRIALTVRLLVHNTRSQRALLSQMSLLDSMLFEDTAGEVNPRNLLTENNLCIMEMERRDTLTISVWKARVTSGLPHPPGTMVKPLPFTKWWTTPVVKASGSVLFTRENLVLTLANKDGGGHVDPRLPADYFALSRENGLDWVVVQGDGSEGPMNNPVLPCVRQIGHEVLLTLDRHRDALRDGNTAA